MYGMALSANYAPEQGNGGAVRCVQEKVLLKLWNRELGSFIYIDNKQTKFKDMTDSQIFQTFFKVRTGPLRVANVKDAG